MRDELNGFPHSGPPPHISKVGDEDKACRLSNSTVHTSIEIELEEAYSGDGERRDVSNCLIIKQGTNDRLSIDI